MNRRICDPDLRPFEAVALIRDEIKRTAPARTVIDLNTGDIYLEDWGIRQDLRNEIYVVLGEECLAEVREVFPERDWMRVLDTTLFRSIISFIRTCDHPRDMYIERIFVTRDAEFGPECWNSPDLRFVAVNYDVSWYVRHGAEGVWVRSPRDAKKTLVERSLSATES